MEFVFLLSPKSRSPFLVLLSSNTLFHVVVEKKMSSTYFFFKQAFKNVCTILFTKTEARFSWIKRRRNLVCYPNSCDFIFWYIFCRGCANNHWYRFCVMMTIIVDMWNQFNTPLHTLSHALNTRFMWRWPHCLKQWEEEGPTWMGLVVVVKKAFKRSLGGKFCKICWRKLEWTNF